MGEAIVDPVLEHYVTLAFHKCVPGSKEPT